MLNAALLLSVLGVVAAWGQGHTIAGNRVVVDRQAHWQQWTFPAGTLDIDETGAVRPHFVPKNILATSDIAAFIKRGKGSEDATLRDALSAGTRAADLVHLFDGDLSTYWEPDPASPLRQWWFEIDLGRLVAATHIRLNIRRRGARRPLPAIRGLDLGWSRGHQRSAQIQPSISHLEVEQGPARI